MNKIIISLDKDFIQLCNNSTILFRPIKSDKNEILTWKEVVKLYEIHPNNFALARSMAGDKSDNITGISGVGLKSVKKYLPFLAEEKSYLFDDIENFCKQNQNAKTKFYKSVLDNLSLIHNNYLAMQLYLPNISPLVTRKIRDIISQFKFELNKTETEKMLYQDGAGENNFQDMYVAFKKMVVDNK